MKIIALLAAVLFLGCAATLDESRGTIKVAAPKAPVSYCRNLSREARWEGAAAQATGALSGTAGILAWPVKSDRGELILAASSGILSAATLALLYARDGATAEWVSAGCGAP